MPIQLLELKHPGSWREILNLEQALQCISLPNVFYCGTQPF